MSTPIKRKVDRTANVSKDSILKTPWPPVTKTLLADCLAVHPGENPAEVNQQIKSLMVAYAGINQARLAVAMASVTNEQDQRVRRRLDKIGRCLSRCFSQFPITVIG